MAVAKTCTKTAVEWTVITFEKICRPPKIVNALAPFLVKMIVLVVVALAYECNLKPTALRKIRAINYHLGLGLGRQRRDELKMKKAVLIRTVDRLDKRQALCQWHDFAAMATYRASQEAEAKALQSAIDAVMAEHGAGDQGDGACVVA